MPKIDITKLYEELQKEFIRPIYIIVGEEAHLALTALKQIRDAIAKGLGENDSSIRTFSGREISASLVVNSLKNVPLFGNRPLVIIREAETISKANLEELTTYIEKPVLASTLIFVAEKLDGRTRFMQVAAKVGAILECKPLYMDRVPGWINMEVKKRGRQISEETAKFLAEMVGNNLGELSGALERIILYIGDRKLIDIKDVEQAVTETHQHDVFELTDAVGSKRFARAISLLQNILENGESPILVLNMLARHFRILSKAKDISGRLKDSSEVARYLGVHPFFAKNYMSQSRAFSAKELRTGFKILHDCDRALKSSRLEKKKVLENALIALMHQRAL